MYGMFVQIPFLKSNGSATNMRFVVALLLGNFGCRSFNSLGFGYHISSRFITNAGGVFGVVNTVHRLCDCFYKDGERETNQYC